MNPNSYPVPDHALHERPARLLCPSCRQAVTTATQVNRNTRNSTQSRIIGHILQWKTRRIESVDHFCPLCRHHIGSYRPPHRLETREHHEAKRQGGQRQKQGQRHDRQRQKQGQTREEKRDGFEEKWRKYEEKRSKGISVSCECHPTGGGLSSPSKATRLQSRLKSPMTLFKSSMTSS